MPFKWDAEADRKLFYCVMIQKNLTFGNEDHATLATMMGEDVSAGAVRNRLSGLKTKLSKEGVASTASSTNTSGGVNLTPKRSKSTTTDTPKNSRGKKNKHSDDETTNETNKRTKREDTPQDLVKEENVDDESYPV